MKITTTLQDFHSKLFRYYIPITKEVGDQFVVGDNRRITCSINGHDPYQCALMHMDGGYYVLVNNQIRNKIGIEEGDIIQVVIEKDHSEFGHEVPESFQALLDQDEEGAADFRSQTMGIQRGLIYIVKKVKNVDSQISKGLAIMHHLKESQGKVDYKRLNVLIKEYNQQRKKGII